MNPILLEKLQQLIEEEVRIQVNKYAQIISKRHDISLKLLLRDVDLVFTEPETTGRCRGITGKKTQCLGTGKHDGYCSRHLLQRKTPLLVAPPSSHPDLPVHIGHSLQECLFLPGCPACELLHKKPKLMIDF
jgi:hypothetical protein